ncbi:probable terpene synthase 6 [Hibiscus syriacus]|uniref:probable terpene synthase 6 n=1 Tax=Hibiscus syriacus TaxID=106335 RepID=UPI00192138AA|nr:probable terpene synthase 6 [Hibiscus syriacus]
MALQASIFTKFALNQGVFMPAPRVNFRGRGPRCLVSTHLVDSVQVSQVPANTHRETFRPLADFPPDIWGDYFMSLSFNNSELKSSSKQVEALKEKVKGMLKDCIDQVEKIMLINDLCRLGLSYHFEDEIQELLSYHFHSMSKLIDDEDLDLHTVATIFQVFRLHGYPMHHDVFNKFTDDEGEFKEELASDVKGLIRLYEASQFRINGEKILDEALVFTTKHLQSSLAKQSTGSHIREYIENALNRPYHKGMPRVEARQYISLYEQDESPNETLLNFAKLDFNRVQCLYQQELGTLSSWSKEMNIASRLPYARNRMVEIFFWAVGFYFEPRYASARNIFAKLLIILGFIDDTYDAYGTFEELECFTHAIQRWDICALDQLPEDYLKILYGAVLNVYDEVDRMESNNGRCYSMSFTKDELKKIVVSYLMEAKWTKEGYMPTFDEYLEIALHSSAAVLVIAQVLVGMEEADANVFEWLRTGESKSLTAINLIARLYDDIATNEDEEKRGLVACGIKCYMKQYGVSKEEAIQEFRRRLGIAWNELNQEFITRPRVVPIQILERVVNIARVIDLTYKDEDGFTMSEKILKHHISNVLIHPVPV